MLDHDSDAIIVTNGDSVCLSRNLSTRGYLQNKDKAASVWSFANESAEVMLEIVEGLENRFILYCFLLLSSSCATNLISIFLQKGVF